MQPATGREQGRFGSLLRSGFATWLIEACAVLRDRNREFSCSIVGGGDLEGELQDLIVRRELGSTVELLGPRPQSEVIQIVQQATVLAAPCVIADDSNRDGLPTVLIEAMALGTPCVSTDVTGIPEIARHEQTGLMVSQRDPSELADAIERLFDDQDLRVLLAKNARRLVETEFDIHQNAAELRELFRNQGGRNVASPVAYYREIS